MRLPDDLASQRKYQDALWVPLVARRLSSAHALRLRRREVQHGLIRKDTVPELTTTSGEVIDFDPAAVTAISAMAPDTRESVTCVYGIEPGEVRTNDPVADLLQSLHLTIKVARLGSPASTHPRSGSWAPP